MFGLYTQKQLDEKLEEQKRQDDFARYIDVRFGDVQRQIDSICKRLYEIEHGGKTDGMDFCTTTNSAKV